MQNPMVQGPLNHPLAESLSRTAARVHYQIRATENLSQAERNEKLKGAAREFEALFVAYILRIMRETIEESGLAGQGLGRNIYTELFDQEVARCIAGRGSFGIADLLVRRLSKSEEGYAAVDAGEEDLSSRPTPIGSRDTRGSSAPSLSPSAVPDFKMPAQAPISSEFGLRKDPINHRLRFHKGLDIAAPEGLEVRAALGGRVVFSGKSKGYGNTVVVEHPGGYRTRYAHLGALRVRTGDLLKTEQILGSVGSTGRSTGPHLHFEVSRYGEAMDPRVALAD